MMKTAICDECKNEATYIANGRSSYQKSRKLQTIKTFLHCFYFCLKFEFIFKFIHFSGFCKFNEHSKDDNNSTITFIEFHGNVKIYSEHFSNGVLNNQNIVST